MRWGWGMRNEVPSAVELLLLLSCWKYIGIFNLYYYLTYLCCGEFSSRWQLTTELVLSISTFLKVSNYLSKSKYSSSPLPWPDPVSISYKINNTYIALTVILDTCDVLTYMIPQFNWILIYPTIYSHSLLYHNHSPKKTHSVRKIQKIIIPKTTIKFPHPIIGIVLKLTQIDQRRNISTHEHELWHEHDTLTPNSNLSIMIYDPSASFFQDS
jgi:hypothetical protein